MNVGTEEGLTVDVKVDKKICASSGACVFTAPDVFEFDDDDEARVVDGAHGHSYRELQEIQYNCPSGAISVTGP